MVDHPETVEEPKNPPNPGESLDALAESLIEGMPAPQQHAIDAALADQAAQAKAAPGFDPAIHALDKDGNPRKNVDGSYSLKRGNKGGKRASILKVPKPTDNVASEQQDKNTVQAAALGVASANLVFVCGMMIGGADFAPAQNELMGVHDRDLLQGAFRDYFLATGQTDLPPGLALTVAIVAYAAPKFTKPKVSERFASVGSKLKGWFSKKR